jgi:hypothetical protein
LKQEILGLGGPKHQAVNYLDESPQSLAWGMETFILSEVQEIQLKSELANQSLVGNPTFGHLRKAFRRLKKWESENWGGQPVS